LKPAAPGGLKPAAPGGLKPGARGGGGAFSAPAAATRLDIWFARHALVAPGARGPGITNFFAAPIGAGGVNPRFMGPNGDRADDRGEV
jgi:hypothetical protein